MRARLVMWLLGRCSGKGFASRRTVVANIWYASPIRAAKSMKAAEEQALHNQSLVPEASKPFSGLWRSLQERHLQTDCRLLRRETGTSAGIRKPSHQEQQERKDRGARGLVMCWLWELVLKRFKGKDLGVESAEFSNPQCADLDLPIHVCLLLRRLPSLLCALSTKVKILHWP